MCLGKLQVSTSPMTFNQHAHLCSFFYHQITHVTSQFASTTFFNPLEHKYFQQQQMETYAGINHSTLLKSPHISHLSCETSQLLNSTGEHYKTRGERKCLATHNRNLRGIQPARLRHGTGPSCPPQALCLLQQRRRIGVTPPKGASRHPFLCTTMNL